MAKLRELVHLVAKKGKVTRPQKDDVNNDDVTFIQTLYTRTEKYKSLISLGENQYGGVTTVAKLMVTRVKTIYNEALEKHVL